MNGQEVHLPSYDEANTWQPDIWVEPQLPPLLNSLSCSLPPTNNAQQQVTDQPISINQFLNEPIIGEKSASGQLVAVGETEKKFPKQNSDEPCCSRSLQQFDVHAEDKTSVVPTSSSTPLIKSFLTNQITDEMADCSLIGSTEDEHESLLKDESKSGDGEICHGYFIFMDDTLFSLKIINLRNNLV